jgi:2-pyrone-4,6-dicarboxylate lactonase
MSQHYTPPAGAIDTHAHIFGPEAKYPYNPDRGYTPADVSVEQYLALLDRLGIAKGVIVQPTVYGTDNRRTADAAASRPDRLRAVAAVMPDVSDVELDRLHAQGVRGTRVSNMARGGVPLELIEAVAKKVKRLGWHVIFMANRGGLVSEMKATLQRLPVPFVVDHIAMNKVVDGLETQAFKDLLDLVRQGNTWVKVSHAYGLTATGAPYHDVAPLARALVETDSSRVLWASDWPHPSHRDHPPDDRMLLDAFAGWITDETHRRQILVENPGILYGFG